MRVHDHVPADRTGPPDELRGEGCHGGSLRHGGFAQRTICGVEVDWSIWLLDGLPERSRTAYQHEVVIGGAPFVRHHELIVQPHEIVAMAPEGRLAQHFVDLHATNDGRARIVDVLEPL